MPLCRALGLPDVDRPGCRSNARPRRSPAEHRLHSGRNAFTLNLEMAMDNKIAFRVRPYLEPGEEIRQVFMAQTRTPYLRILVPLFGYTLAVVGYLLVPEAAYQIYYWVAYCLFMIFGYGVVIAVPLLLFGLVVLYILLWPALTYHVIGPRIVVVTDRKVIVLRAQGRWPTFPTGAAPLARLPLQIRFGRRLLWHWTSVEGERLWIAGRPHRDAAQAGPRARPCYCLRRVTNCFLVS
ncbi:hypothetical protein [Frankia sp. R43]|uniref:hypothetical protein n=1 Tax=Frankia sp. R43 TaxID=269536 RepID=UPI001F43A59D|nr:hypothetical protein [Frankia sp. R43]